MRLLNVETLQLEDPIYPGAHNFPRYSILSHTWGKGEVSFQDLTSGSAQGLAGYEKLVGCCAKSMAAGFEHTWIDTCCIDKSSSAELSEAINSMFAWYNKAEVCYAYLSDVDGLGSDSPDRAWSSFRKSRWFRRGWTLQELLAPAEVVFLNRDWVEIGTKASLASIITGITLIATGALRNNALCGSETVAHVCHGYSVAQKMSWAALREATREEDRAYSLMELFGVNMPLLYGEGGDKAFTRLQREIMRQSSDDSIFAWSTVGWEGWASRRHLSEKKMDRSGLVAWRPELFYAGFTVHTPAAAEKFNLMQDTRWTEVMRAHTSTAYDEEKQFVSLNAPILTSHITYSRNVVIDIFPLYESSAPSPARYKALRRGRPLNNETLFNLLFKDPKRVIAILSCCFEFGRVGIVLEERRDGTYCRVHEPSIVGVQVNKLPQPQALKIRHKAGVGDVCASQIPSYERSIMSVEVVLLEGGLFGTPKIL